MVDLGDRRDLDAGAAQEHLVGDVQLGPVDRADLDRDLLVAEQLHHREAGHALEDVVVDRRGQRHAVADDEEVRRGCLVDVAVGGQDDRLVVAVHLGLGLLEGHVHVAADDLAAGRQCLVRIAPPG